MRPSTVQALVEFCDNLGMKLDPTVPSHLSALEKFSSKYTIVKKNEEED